LAGSLKITARVQAGLVSISRARASEKWPRRGESFSEKPDRQTDRKQHMKSEVVAIVIVVAVVIAVVVVVVVVVVVAVAVVVVVVVIVYIYI
jgi:Flp pilus assembly protein TadB